MEQHKRLSSHQKSKRAQNMDNKRGAPQIYNTNKDGFKAMVLRLTSIVPPSSRDQNDVLPSPPPRALHPQPVMSNTARFPLLPYRYLTLPVRNNAVNISPAALSNTQPPRFFPPLPPQYQPAPVNISAADLSNTQPPQFLPHQYQSAPVNISAADLSNVQPPPSTTASPFLPPLPPQYSSVPTGINDVNISNFQPLPSATAFLPPLPPQYQPVPTRINDVNISAAELSNVQPPPSPLSQPSPLPPPPSTQEQEPVDDSVAAFMQHFESFMTEDDSNEQYLSAWSPFHDMIMASTDKEQEQPAENIPSSVPMTLPPESLDWLNPTYDLPPTPATDLDWSSNFTYDSQLASMNLPDMMFNHPDNVPTPVPVTSPYEMVPPATLPFGNYQNNLPSEDISPPIPTDLPSWSQYWPNHQQPENIPPPPPVPMDYSSFGSQPRWPDSQNEQLPQMAPPSVPSTLPFGNYQTDPRAQMYLAQSGFATVPSWNLDWDRYPSVQRSER